jgi:hypothetical protein
MEAEREAELRFECLQIGCELVDIRKGTQEK